MVDQETSTAVDSHEEVVDLDEKSLSTSTDVDTATEAALSEPVMEEEPSQEEIVNQLSIKLLEQTQHNGVLENNILELKRKNAELWRQSLESRKMKEASDREVEKLSTEMEELSATLFDQANNKVKEANIEADDYKTRNSRLLGDIRQKDETIELLSNELQQLKGMISTMTENFQTREQELEEQRRRNESPATKLGPAAFSLESLGKYNGEQIYSPIYNQLRFDLHYFNQFRRALMPRTSHTFSIRDSSFFKTFLVEEIEPVLRLDLAPAVKFYQHRSFITSLMDSKVSIEPLSAATELWKSTNLKESGSSDLKDSDLKDSKLVAYDTDRPVASRAKCALCGESRDSMNSARLYKLRVNEVEYNLCIACADRLRAVVEVLKYLKTLQATSSEEEVIKAWCHMAPMRGKLFYTKLGLWTDADECGLVYGWKNTWLGHMENQLAEVSTEGLDDSKDSVVTMSDRNPVGPPTELDAKEAEAGARVEADAGTHVESDATVPAVEPESKAEPESAQESTATPDTSLTAISAGASPGNGISQPYAPPKLRIPSDETTSGSDTEFSDAVD